VTCDGNTHICGIRAGDLSIIRKQANELHAIRKLIAHARLISPSERAVIYVADIERALGIDAPVPHRLGGNDG
jgi:hypothetical protein